MQIEPTPWEHAFLALIVLGGVYAVFRGQPKALAIEWDRAARIGTYLANGALLFALGGLAVMLWWQAGRPLADLGLRVGSYGPLTVALAAGFVVALALETRSRLSPARRRATIAEWRRERPFAPTTNDELAWCTFLSVAAGINEEIVFRGFLISYGLWLFGGSTVGVVAAVLVPAIGFGLVHRYQAWRKVGLIVLLSIVFGAIYLLSGSLLVPIALHVGLDVFSSWLGVRTLAAYGGEPSPAAVTPSAGTPS